jgi:hypothetical protein
MNAITGAGVEIMSLVNFGSETMPLTLKDESNPNLTLKPNPD